MLRCGADKDKEDKIGATSSVQPGVRSSTCSKTSRRLDDCDTPGSQPPSAKQKPCKQARSSSKQLSQEATGPKDPKAEPPPDAYTADPLSRKSSEGLRWISKPSKEEVVIDVKEPSEVSVNQMDKPTRIMDQPRSESGVDGSKPTEESVNQVQVDKPKRITDQPEGEAEIDGTKIKTEVVEHGTNLMSAKDSFTKHEAELGKPRPVELGAEFELSASRETKMSANEDSQLTVDSTGSYDPITGRRLPSAPSALVSHESVAICGACICLFFFLCIAVIVLVYRRWTVSTPTFDAVPKSHRQLSGEFGGDSSVCDSLFSFSHCPDSDMLG